MLEMIINYVCFSNAHLNIFIPGSIILIRFVTCNINWNTENNVLSHDIASGSDITPCEKIDKPLVVYRFGNKM